MAQSIVAIEIVRPGERAEQLVQDAAEALDGSPARVSARLYHLWFPMDYEQARALVEQALQGAGEDWNEYVGVPRPD